MKKSMKGALIPSVLALVLCFGSTAFAANCFLYKKNSYATKAGGTKCWYQDFRTGSSPAAPAGFMKLSSKGLKPGQNCAAEFTGYAKSAVTSNSWSCVKVTLNGAVMGTKGAP